MTGFAAYVFYPHRGHKKLKTIVHALPMCNDLHEHSFSMLHHYNDSPTYYTYCLDLIQLHNYAKLQMGCDNGFKCEWIAVKDDHMYVGGLGKVWTSEVGVVINHNPQFIKIISKSGEVEHVDWQFNYNAMRKKAGIEDPGKGPNSTVFKDHCRSVPLYSNLLDVYSRSGTLEIILGSYVIHESAVWSKIHKKWFFLPRRASTTKYNDKEDEKKGTNLLIKCSENFQDISITKIGEFSVPTHGFSSFKFVPNTLDNIIVALKSEEDGDIIASYIMVFTVGGQILFPEKKIANLKFEGIEFI
ncbi:Soluble calcium-activated nucleotidase 1 [Nymphon striatum]|nr:Soluble calcium-activated nucleotidase 1 [Nymphon striatum]